MAYRNGCGEDGREGYSLEGESPSMMTLGNAPSGVFSLLSDAYPLAEKGRGARSGRLG